VASFFVVDARTQHTFLLGTSLKSHSTLTKSGFGKPKAAKLDNPSDAVLRERGHGAVLGDEGKAVGMQSADGFTVCACHARQQLPAALVCRRTRRLLCRRIKWRAPYMIDEPTQQRPRRDDCGTQLTHDQFDV
jgi:hypothetical protein